MNPFMFLPEALIPSVILTYGEYGHLCESVIYKKSNLGSFLTWTL